MSEVQAALLRSQMRRLPEQNRVRMENAEYLSDRLAEISGIRVLTRDPDVTRSSIHVYLARFISEEFEGLSRDSFIKAVEAEGIPLRTGYRAPLQEYALFAGGMDFPQGENWYSNAALNGGVGYSGMETPVASRLCSEEAITLYQSVFLGPRADMDSIVEAIAKVRENIGELIGAGTTV